MRVGFTDRATIMILWRDVEIESLAGMHRREARERKRETERGGGGEGERGN